MGIVLILCVTIIFTFYMYGCFQKEIGMFGKPQYEKRIKALEEKVFSTRNGQKVGK